MKKILITGGAGFIGSHLINLLMNKRYEVLVFDNLSLGRQKYIAPYLDHPRFSFIKLDLLDKEKLFSSLPEDIDTVFHLATNSDISKSANDTSIDFKNTIIATYNILETMRKKKIKNIFYTSSGSVYGDVGLTYTAENYGPLFPESIYGAAKLSAEAIISSYMHMFDMHAWIVRPANIIGPRLTHGVIFDFINKLRNDPGHLEILGNGKQSKSYVYITDVLDAFLLIRQKTHEPVNLFNLTSTGFVTVTQIAEIIIIKMGLKNVKVTYTGGNVGWNGDVPRTRLTGDALMQLGWIPEYTSKSAVEQTVDDLLTEL